MKEPFFIPIMTKKAMITKKTDRWYLTGAVSDDLRHIY